MCGPLIAWIASILGAFALGCLCAGLLAHAGDRYDTPPEIEQEHEAGVYDLALLMRRSARFPFDYDRGDDLGD